MKFEIIYYFIINTFIKKKVRIDIREDGGGVMGELKSRRLSYYDGTATGTTQVVENAVVWKVEKTIRIKRVYMEAHSPAIGLAAGTLQYVNAQLSKYPKYLSDGDTAVQIGEVIGEVYSEYHADSGPLHAQIFFDFGDDYIEVKEDDTVNLHVKYNNAANVNVVVFYEEVE